MWAWLMESGDDVVRAVLADRLEEIGWPGVAWFRVMRLGLVVVRRRFWCVGYRAKDGSLAPMWSKWDRDFPGLAELNRCVNEVWKATYR
jgi:hypothetical protein